MCRALALASHESEIAVSHMCRGTPIFQQVCISFRYTATRGSMTGPLDKMTGNMRTE